MLPAESILSTFARYFSCYTMRPVKYSVDYHCLVHNQDDMQLMLLYLT